MNTTTLVAAVVLALATTCLAADHVYPSPWGPPTSQPTSMPEVVYQRWPFDAKEAGRRQDETAKALGSPKELVLDLGHKVTMKLVLVPAGKFVMGSPAAEKLRYDHEAQHEVTISKPFYMGIYPVTQEQWEAITGNNPSDHDGASNPVGNVSWNDSVAFLRKLSSKVGRAVQLPTEAQWEYACRAGTDTPFNTGQTITVEQANFDGSRPYPGAAKTEYKKGRTLPVGRFKPNAFGLYDMHGSIGQWCADWFGDYPKGAVVDPTGPADGETRVFRGGGWGNDAKDIRSACRNFITPDYSQHGIIGLRVVVPAGQ